MCCPNGKRHTVCQYINKAAIDGKAHFEIELKGSVFKKQYGQNCIKETMRHFWLNDQ